MKGKREDQKLKKLKGFADKLICLVQCYFLYVVLTTDFFASVRFTVIKFVPNQKKIID